MTYFSSPTGTHDWLSSKSSKFGAYRAHPGAGDGHNGVDLTIVDAAGRPRDDDDAWLVAIADGWISKIYWSNGGGGWILELSLGNVAEVGPDVVARYMHNQQEHPVKVGDKVKEGDRVALQGDTGNATGPHVHFEIRTAGKPIDPRPLLKEFAYVVRGVPVSTLRLYSRGPHAKYLQSMLHWHGYGGSVGTIDGDFGKKTRSAVMRFQADKGLKADAIVGMKTWDRLIPRLGRTSDGT